MKSRHLYQGQASASPCVAKFFPGLPTILLIIVQIKYYIHKEIKLSFAKNRYADKFLNLGKYLQSYPDNPSLCVVPGKWAS